MHNKVCINRNKVTKESYLMFSNAMISKLNSINMFVMLLITIKEKSKGFLVVFLSVFKLSTSFFMSAYKIADNSMILDGLISPH